jgi:hypothetical protein
VDGPAIENPVDYSPTDRSITQTYSIWKQFPQSAGSRNLAWRMSQFLGVQPASVPELCADLPVTDRTVVAIDDANLGFRSQSKQWIENIESAAHVIYKMSAPVFDEPFGQLFDRLGERLTVQFHLSDLRKSDASIGQSLSWEQLATEIRDELVSSLGGRRPSTLVVTIGTAGALVLTGDDQATLVFDPEHQETGWEREYPGSPIWIGTYVIAALALDRITGAGSNSAEAVAKGLKAMRASHIAGYIRERIDVPGAATTVQIQPIDNTDDVTPFALAPVGKTGSWNLLPIDSPAGIHELAKEIVLSGERKACAGVPIERIGHWASVDRSEIEGVRSLRSIVEAYLQPGRKVRPLNVAVFGPPGSGKSFAVKQMSRQWMETGIPLDILEFNVSQFSDPSDLAQAFHRIRDSAVRERMPLVFWDEFDTPYQGRELGWLARFLAPMQDGTFLEGGMERPLGHGVFVFAGGTHPTLASFINRAVNVPGAKATDFLSRLRGHIDVLGPNRRDKADTGYVLRRALLIRALISQRAPQMIQGQRMNIDAGVLDALLRTTEYLHGARSIEAIIEMSALSGRLRFERSLLPSEHQLALHVDPAQFLALVHNRSSELREPGDPGS